MHKVSISKEKHIRKLLLKIYNNTVTKKNRLTHTVVIAPVPALCNSQKIFLK